MIGFGIGIVGLIIGVIYSEPLKRKVLKRFYENTENEKRIYNLVESSKDIIYYCDVKPQLKYRYISPALDDMLRPNLVKDSIKNPYTVFEIIHPDDSHILKKKVSGEIDFNKPIVMRWKDQHGMYKWFEEYSTPIYMNGEIVAIQGIIRNIDEKVLLQQELEYKIEHDAITGIYNRTFFEKQKRIYNEETDESVAIILCDLDELKWMNDNYGHQMGDKLIIQTSKLLDSFSNETVLLSRIGGDEFAFLLTKIDLISLCDFTENLRKEVANYNMKHPNFMIKISIGYAYEVSSIGKMDELFIRADQNMYKEKNIRKPVEIKA